MNHGITHAMEMIARMSAINQSSDSERWVRGWAALADRLEVETIVSACNRAIQSEASNAADAKLVRVALRRSQLVAKRLCELERFIASPYPRDKARQRLDNELGWERITGESDTQAIDRSVMKSRVNAPPDSVLIANEFRTIRGDFAILERLAG